MPRRRLLRAGAGGVLLLGGCGGNGSSPPTPAATVGTPIGPVPGFDDPKRWTGRTLRVGAWGGEIQAALEEAVWKPFAVATGCAIEGTTTDYAQLRGAIAEGRPFADVLLADAIWAETAPEQGYIQPLAGPAVDSAVAAAFGGSAGAVPAFAYALVSAYRRDAIEVEAPPQTWGEWWNAKR